MSDQKVVAVYDTAAHADAAVNMLKSAGYSAHDICMIRNEGHAAKPDFTETGFWYRLFGRDITSHEAEAYGRSATAGSVTVSVRVAASEAAKVIRLLNASQTAEPFNAAQTPGSSDTKPVRVLVPPPTSTPTFTKAK
jgi:hypothetical protein